jgi:phytoene dehydrogenase-like protein
VHGGGLLSRTYDAVVIGSGVNSLACAAFLARAGWGVAVLERETELGGAVRTAGLTEPGYLHDVFSAWHPLWSAGRRTPSSAMTWRGTASST